MLVCSRYVFSVSRCQKKFYVRPQSMYFVEFSLYKINDVQIDGDTKELSREIWVLQNTWRRLYLPQNKARICRFVSRAYFYITMEFHLMLWSSLSAKENRLYNSSFSVYYFKTFLIVDVTILMESEKNELDLCQELPLPILDDFQLLVYRVSQSQVPMYARFYRN